MTIFTGSSRAFADAVGHNFLHNAIEWIHDNLDFEDVFPDWKKQVRTDYLPEDLFTKEDLDTWAEDHGWVRDLEDDGK